MRSLETSNLSAGNFKKTRKLDGSTTEPAIRSCDIGQWIPCFDSCQLNTQIKKGRFCIGYPVSQTDVRSRDYQNISDVFLAMGLGSSAPGAPLSASYFLHEIVLYLS